MIFDGRPPGVDPHTTWPDIQILMMSATPGTDAGLLFRWSLNMGPEMWSKWSPLAARDGFMLQPILLHPKSRGRVRLRSRDPKDKPDIRPNFYSHPQDVETMIGGVVKNGYCFNGVMFQLVSNWPFRLVSLLPLSSTVQSSMTNQ